MAVQRKRLKPGDVLLLNTAGVIAYLQYIGRHTEYGDAVIVGQRFDEPHATVTDRALSGGYVAFYPATAAVAQGLVEVVGHLPAPDLPQRLRRPGVRSGRRIDTWIIENGTGETTKSSLTTQELQLPIAAIWNHELLVQRIAEGWKPALDGHSR
jgi:hypothetical protein